MASSLIDTLRRSFAVNLEENLKMAFPNVEIKPKPAPPAAAATPGAPPTTTIP